MKVKVNLQGNFKTVQEGERILEITDAKATPSGKPEKLQLNMKDVQDGASLLNSYTFSNETSVWLMGMMLNTALGIEDGGEFDTKDASTDLNQLIDFLIHPQEEGFQKEEKKILIENKFQNLPYQSLQDFQTLNCFVKEGCWKAQF